nr:uncharacterized protein LOC106630224 [Zonotrichia albicollis]
MSCWHPWPGRACPTAAGMGTGPQMAQGVTELRGQHPPWQGLAINKHSKPHLSSRKNFFPWGGRALSRVWGFPLWGHPNPTRTRPRVPCPRLGWMVPRGPCCDSVNWWRVTVRTPKGNWGCCASWSSLPVPVPRHPSGSARLQGRPPCPHSFLGSSWGTTRTQGPTGSWPGPGATGGHSCGATGARPWQFPHPTPNGTVCKSRNFKPKINEPPHTHTHKKAFSQSSPWLIPADVVEVTDWHQSGHCWHCPVSLGWRWLCPLPPPPPPPPRAGHSHHFGFLPVSTVSSSEPTASFSKDFTIL